MKNNDFDKIERYINGESNDSEKEYVEALFLDGESNLYFKHSLEKVWEVMLKDNPPTEVNLSHLLDRVHNIILKNEILKKNKPLFRFVRIYMRAAAVLLLPLIIAGGIIFGILQNRQGTDAGQKVTSTIYAPLGSRVAFILPDSTSGMLNSGSRLVYTIPFTNDRHIKLVGEAWFEVKHDEKNPFEISTPNSTIKVLGTSFNLSAYPEENYVEVVLREGTVEFKDKNDEKVTIHSKERLVCQNGNIKKSIADPEKYIAWTEGKLVFRGDPMAEVARRIERWYNVTIVIADKELERYSFRGTFEDDSLNEVLKYLALTSPIGYNITPRILLPDGTYKKEVVTIFKS